MVRLVTIVRLITDADDLCSSLNCVVGGVMALSVECRTCDQEVVGLSLGLACGVKTRQVSHTFVPVFTKQYKLVPTKGR